MRVKIAIKGDQDTMDRLKKLGNQLHDFSSAMRIIGQTVANYSATTGFTDQGRPFGAPWAPLSPRYLKWKEKHFPGRPMLVLHGNMQRGFFYKSDANSVTIDNQDPKFKYHQSTREPRTRIPRRATMGVNNGIRATIGQIIEKDVRTKIDGVKL